MTPFRLALLLLVLAGVATWALRRSPGDGALAPEVGSGPVGRWRLDRAALLAQVAEVYGSQGAEAVAREQERARGVALDLELLADGRYAYRTVSMGLSQLCRGKWKREAERLSFQVESCDDEQADLAAEGRHEEALFRDGQIHISFPEARLTFTLVRHQPGDE